MASASSAPPRVFAIVPAAGQSRRLGTSKQLLEVDGQPLLLRLLGELGAAGPTAIILVTNRATAEQLDLGQVSGLHLAYNEDPSSEMIDSIRCGLRALDAWRPEELDDGILVTPADQVGLVRADFSACLRAWRASPDRLVLASRAGRRGHPLIFPRALAPFVMGPDCDAGLNALPRAHADLILAVERENPELLTDLDTPADVQRWRTRQGDPSVGQEK